MDTRLSADDRWEIHDLYARYCWALDYCDPEGWADTFSPDGFHGGNSGTRVRGRDELVDYAARIGDLIAAKALQHWNANIYVRSDGAGGAIGRCYMLAAMAAKAPVMDRPGVVIERMGRYSDRLARIDGRWVFTEKIFENYYVGVEPFAEFASWL